MKNKQKLINLILKEVGKINNETLEENKSKQNFWNTLHIPKRLALCSLQCAFSPPQSAFYS